MGTLSTDVKHFDLVGETRLGHTCLSECTFEQCGNAQGSASVSFVLQQWIGRKEIETGCPLCAT